MPSRRILITSAVAAAIVGVGIWAMRGTPPESANHATCRDFQEADMLVGNARLAVSIAATPDEKHLGLSGCPELPENTGLLFPYESPQPATFWMKDMVMAIDIVWIREGKVVGIEANVPPPAPETPVQDLPQYHSPEPIDAVLEIKASGAEEYGITVGSPVILGN